MNDNERIDAFDNTKGKSKSRYKNQIRLDTSLEKSVHSKEKFKVINALKMIVITSGREHEHHHTWKKIRNSK